MKNKLIILSCIVIIVGLIGVISAERVEKNEMFSGKIDTSGDITKTGSLSNVNVTGYKCNDINCVSLGNKWLEKFSGSKNPLDVLNIIYPTSRLSKYYGIYFFLEDYIPHEKWSNYSGDDCDYDKPKDYEVILTKAETCTSNIKSLIITNDSSKIYVESVIQSPINHAGELDYVPSGIDSHYTVDVNITLNVKKEGSNYHTESKIVNINFSGEKEVNFSFDADEGNYSVTITTDKGDEKCINGNLVSKTDSIIINAPQCIENITHTEWSDWENITQCRVNNTILQKRIKIKYDANDCGFVNQTEIAYNEISCEYNQTDNNPPGSISNLHVDSKSYNWIKWEWDNPGSDFNYSIIYLNGSWEANTSNNYYNATGLDENTSYTITIHTIDDEGNINDTDVSHTANTDAVQNCTCDSNCPDDNYGNKYCKGDDIYKKFYDYFCDNGMCNYNVSETFVKSCPFDCEEGKCVDEEDEEEDEERNKDRGFRIIEDNETISDDFRSINVSNFPKIKLGSSDSENFSIWPFVLIVLIILLIIIILIVLYLF